MMKLKLLPFLLLVIAISGCGNTGERNDDPIDSGTDTGTVTGTDLDTDVDSDTDADTDSDADSDAGPGDDSGVIEMDCTYCPSTGPSLTNMMCAIDLCDSAYVIQTSYQTLLTGATCNVEDTYEAVNHFGNTTNGLAPKKNDSYALMASGIATGTSHTTDLCQMSLPSDPWTTETSDINDVMEWHMVLQAPHNAKGFRFKYVFFSEEYDDFIGTQYNDKFYIVLQAGSTLGGTPKIINFTECRDPYTYYDFICQPGDTSCTPGEKYCYIAINSALSECCWYGGCPGGTATTDISGTGYECAASSMGGDGPTHGSSSGWLQTSWPIEPDETFVLIFHIHDTGDGVYDSEVIIDSFEFLAEPTEEATVPID